MPSVNSSALIVRISEIRQALQYRQLEDSAKLRMLMSEKDINAVANVVSGGIEAAQGLLLEAAKAVVWARACGHLSCSDDCCDEV
jgi:hypothetical protein